MALAEKLFGRPLRFRIVDHLTYIICGCGCLREGISEEAISRAVHLKLNKMIVLWDYNKITIDGATSFASSSYHFKRFEANGWNTDAVDGHNAEEIAAALEKAKKSDRPTLIACRTVIGYGSSKEGTEKTHGSPIGTDDLLAARKRLGFEYAPFEVPEDVMKEWRAAGARGAEAREAWEKRFAAQPAGKKAEFERTVIKSILPAGWKTP